MLVFGFVIGITVYFLVTGYYTQLKLYEDGELHKLSGIANTLCMQIDGDVHEDLYRKYSAEGEIKSTTQDSVYTYYHRLFREVAMKNGLANNAIYTMVYEPSQGNFNLCIFSDSVYWRSPWNKFQPDHVSNYETGGVVHTYMDEHGTWLSALAPIANTEGKVVAAVQVDMSFDVFISQARKEILFRALISLVVIGLIGFFLFRSVRAILVHEEKLAAEVLESHAIIEAKNKDITDSIQYAKRIQEAILPSVEHIRKQLQDSFVLFLPRDIVSGDFYWYADCDDRIFFAAVDCTGHGVPGGFMSMIGNTLLNEIIIQKQVTDPGKILDLLDAGIRSALKQKENGSEARDGMDLSLISICKHQKDLKFAGAFRPLLHVRNDNMTEHRADRFPIGGGSAYVKTPFNTVTVDLQPGDLVYMYSDGYPDQIGGTGSKKFMTKQFKEILMNNRHLPMVQQENILRQHLYNWQGEHEQMDDILVIGIRLVK
jgi:serine phosphatase RsbU (regulator of sigma subunit)